MTAQEIITYTAERLLKKAMDTADGLGWLNDALEDMGVDAGLFKEQAIVSVAGVWNDLPADCLKVYEVRDSTGCDYYGWEADRKRIRLADDGTFTLRYYRPPIALADGEQVPECPEVFHRALAYYIAYRFEARDFPGENATLAWLSEYQTRLERVRTQLQKNAKLVNVRVWR
ncbi:hypothetical protein [Desulfallas thermosapovorans]|uniref:Uncharacterized protein n=1 Tax=Desulfallas thermosapovorans DSM 6562 TaxID=1121431 RepID=A0A5S4ZQI1_9FIRM|nr:hypothetical protein [Desulfallas thermosapovorans]TYO95128.1 hypothetical protein LX24_01857 [Desulfallas thermosapovorans DSM 6562]